jgi:hypothetical protein
VYCLQDAQVASEEGIGFWNYLTSPGRGSSMIRCILLASTVLGIHTCIVHFPSSAIDVKLQPDREKKKRREKREWGPNPTI